jgi:CheY-like chemotaxis protein
MIVCVLDDLIFSVKISTAARRLGVETYFERSRDRVVETVRDRQPTLVIFDLNSSRLAPMTAISALKADPRLKAIRTLGYVSHVDATTAAEAREAGIDQVMARSAFSDRLAEILTGA